LARAVKTRTAGRVENLKSQMYEPPLGDDPEAPLRRALMEEYVSDQGHALEDLASLDDDERERLVLEAAAYAALRLSERAYDGTRRES
jgi:hypothetical protein